MRGAFERSARRLGPSRRIALVLWMVLGSLADLQARAQIPIPGLPGTAPPAPATPKGDDKDKPDAAPTQDNPEATVATTSGPINVDEPSNDPAVQKTLEQLLPRYPGVRNAEIDVKHGVVTLEGQVENNEVRDNVTQFTRRVEGVTLVLNRMKTDAQVLTARQLALNVLKGFWQAIARNWLLVVIALGAVMISAALARLFGTYSETLLAPFVRNVLLRSVIGSFLSFVMVVGGVLLGLSVLNLTRAVLSILGFASIVGLAIGFAFRDIAENFIASVLLGVRRPFRVGDYVTVAGNAGVVRTLNTRATVLVTLEGTHVRIPNNVIFKEILVNSSASASSRSSFDVIIPYEVSTATALEAITHALRDQEGILPDPPARALVEALEPVGVRLRAYFWVPAQGVDGFKLQSDARLRVKVALQKAGITPPPSSVLVSVIGHVPVEISEADGRARPEAAMRPGAIVTAEQARANLHHDSKAATNGSALPADGHQTPIEHALNQDESRVSDEGKNLLEVRKEEGG
jgi:small conductance mechanosensitive channel